jgi:hypothetical protein
LLKIVGPGQFEGIVGLEVNKSIFFYIKWSISGGKSDLVWISKG